MNIKIELNAEAVGFIKELTEALRELTAAIQTVKAYEGVTLEAIPMETQVEPEKKDDPCIPEPDSPSATDEGPSFKEIRARLLAATQSHGRDAVFGILSSFKVDRFPDLDASEYPELLKKLKSLGV